MPTRQIIDVTGINFSNGKAKTQISICKSWSESWSIGAK